MDRSEANRLLAIANDCTYPERDSVTTDPDNPPGYPAWDPTTGITPAEMVEWVTRLSARIGDVDDALAKYMQANHAPVDPLTTEQQQRIKALTAARDVLASKQFVGSNINGRDVYDLIHLANWVMEGWGEDGPGDTDEGGRDE